MICCHVQYDACVHGGFACVVPPTIGRYGDEPLPDEYRAALPADRATT